ncbi:MAG: hypothetical protein JO145_00220 [Acidobacteriaceae bacterium]|nr:hypothetical protein [Acidobacteriaceae bacterium]
MRGFERRGFDLVEDGSEALGHPGERLALTLRDEVGPQDRGNEAAGIGKMPAAHGFLKVGGPGEIAVALMLEKLMVLGNRPSQLRHGSLSPDGARRRDCAARATRSTGLLTDAL